MIRILLLNICLVSAGAYGQSVTFTQEEFINVITQYHPVAKQAQLDIKIAEADIIRSRAGFDPVLSSNNEGKEVGGLTYYNNRLIQLKIPAWYGVDLVAGHERITGARNNPEETAGTLEYVGFSIPLLKNVGMDKRRADLKQAKIFRTLAETEKKVIVNDLVREARDAYWSWWKAEEVTELTRLAFKNAEQRFSMIRSSVKVGERASIDTIEAATQLQNMWIRLIEAESELLGQRVYLSSFLWSINGTQYELPQHIKPEPWKPEKAPSIEALTVSANNHPAITRYGMKLQSLRVERRLKFQSLLPEVNLKYNQLGYDFNTSLKNAWFENNQRFGLQVSVPLLLSQGRGELRKANLKIMQTTIEGDNKRVEQLTKLRRYLIEWQQLYKQIEVQQELVVNLRLLQNGEEIKFKNGESALFFINARELATLTATQKLVDLKASYQKSLNALLWASGTFSSL